MSWQPNSAPQARALSVDIFELLYGGARGGGKTDAGIVWIGVPAFGELSNRLYRGLVVRKNYEDLKDWVDRAKRFYEPYNGSYNKSDKEFSFPSGSVIRCGHMKDSDAYEKYQGHEYQRILLEELTQIPDEENYLRLIASCRSTVPGLQPSVFSTANPGGPGHSWVKKRFISPAPAGQAFQDPTTGLWRLFIPARAEDNPALDDQYKAGLNGLPEKLRAAWRDGNWDVLSGQFFTDFDRAAHVVAPRQIPPHWRRYCGFDWGYSPDPWVCLWIAVDERENEWIYRERHGNKQTPAEVARVLIDASRDDGQLYGCMADPSAWSKRDGVDIAEKMVLAGWYMAPADNTRVQGWVRCHEYLKPGKTRIFSTCTNLIEAITEAQHDERNPSDVAAFNMDHWLDAWRYHLMSRPSRASLPETQAPRNSMEWFRQRRVTT